MPRRPKAPPSKNTGYSAVIRRLESRIIMPEKAPTLEPMHKALHQVGFFNWPYWKKHSRSLEKIIVVAGTNGKGSTCATLEALLLSAGRRVGFYSSPHLEKYTERMRIDGRDISQKLFTQAYVTLEPLVANLKLSHFEMLTLMALWSFCSGVSVPPVEYLILEVGLGGIWDATNSVPHETSVITPIGYDHQNLLGSTLTEIAGNKLGIIGDRGRVIHTPFPEEISKLVAATKGNRDSGDNVDQCRWIECAPFETSALAAPARRGRATRFFLSTSWGKAPLKLPGRRGAENSALALTVFAALGFNPKKHLKALAHVRWPGRMEYLGHQNPRRAPIYLSGDHNPQGVESLLELLPYYKRKKLFILAGIGKDKDRDEILEKLFSIPDAEVFLTETSFKPTRVADYGRWLKKSAGHDAQPLKLLKKIIKRAGPDDMILVTGSLYLVGTIRQRKASPGTKTAR